MVGKAYYRMIFDTLQTVFNRLLISILPLGVSNLPVQFCLAHNAPKTTCKST